MSGGPGHPGGGAPGDGPRPEGRGPLPQPRAIPLFAWLLVRSARNRAVRMIRRLRRPRYAVAIVAGLLYVGWIVSGIAGGAGGEEPAPFTDVLELAAPLVLLVLAGIWWLAGGYESALAFSPAEVHFLFPAPLHRRTVLHVRLLRSQGAIALNAAIFTLFFHAGALGWPFRLVSLWILLTTLHLHQVGSSLVRLGTTRGRPGLRRLAWTLTVFAAVAGVLLWNAASALPAIRAAPDGEAAWAALREALERPSLRLVLLAPRMLLAPLLAADVGSWAAALPAALGLAVLHYLWVIRTDARFEEAAAEAGRRRAARLEALRSGRSALALLERGGPPSRPWFRLRPTGPAAVAFFWKSFLDFTRTIRKAIVALMVGGAAAVFLLIAFLDGSMEAGAEVVVVLSLVLPLLLLAMGPLVFRVDLRKDLLLLDLLKTYPAPGAAVVTGEVLAAAAALTVTQLAFVALGLPFVPLLDLEPLLLARVAAGAGAALLLLPLVNLVAMAIQNALVLLLPGWMHLGADRTQGVEMMGQFMVATLVNALLMALALAGPALLAGRVALATFPLLGAWAALPALVAAAAGLGAVAWLLLFWMGDVYDGLDAAEAELLA